MKRAVVFAHFDKDNIVDDYVVYYLKALKNAGTDIVFVSCNPINNKEVISDFVINIIDEQHDEYDFGSYKRGYFYLKDCLNKYDELLFVNDSCFGPFYSLDIVFEQMEKENCDFWGITKNLYACKDKSKKTSRMRPNIQSYFIALKKCVFMSEIFDDFMKSIQHEEDKFKIITKYEIGLTQKLIESGYSYKTYITAYEKIDNSPILKWYQLILKYKMPFMKCSLARLKNNMVATVAGYDDVICKVSCYPIKLIENNALRYGVELKHYSPASIFIKRMAYNTALFLPNFVRKTLVFLAGFALKHLKD